MTSGSSPLAGVFGATAFGEPTSSMATFGPTTPPLWGPKRLGPRFMARPVAAGRHSGYGPPFGVVPGAVPSHAAVSLRTYPNNPWGGFGAEVPDTDKALKSVVLVVGALVGGLWLLSRLGK